MRFSLRIETADGSFQKIVQGQTDDDLRKRADVLHALGYCVQVWDGEGLVLSLLSDEHRLTS